MHGCKLVRVNRDYIDAVSCQSSGVVQHLFTTDVELALFALYAVVAKSCKLDAVPD